MVGALRDRGIELMVCLHHFTDPLWFADRGGWESAEAPALFQRYVRTVVAALRDLCDFWLAFNEPLVYLGESFDFFGVNYYSHYLVRFVPDPRRLFGEERYSDAAELSDSGSSGPHSEYFPQGLFQICSELGVFGKPVYITENGLPDRDDDQRPRWLLGHLHQIHRAIQTGCDVRGYYHWTFVDNFEWNEGWSLRFGLVQMGPTTQVRTMRPSAHLYGEIARANCISAHQFAAHPPRLVSI